MAVTPNDLVLATKDLVDAAEKAIDAYLTSTRNTQGQVPIPYDRRLGFSDIKLAVSADLKTRYIEAGWDVQDMGIYETESFRDSNYYVKVRLLPRKTGIRFVE